MKSKPKSQSPAEVLMHTWWFAFMNWPRHKSENKLKFRSAPLQMCLRTARSATPVCMLVLEGE